VPVIKVRVSPGTVPDECRCSITSASPKSCASRNNLFMRYFRRRGQAHRPGVWTLEKVLIVILKGETVKFNYLNKLNK
jgi:hypothetical protein